MMSDSAETLRQELRLWRQIKEKSRSEYGPFNRDPNLVVTPLAETEADWYDVQPFVEYQLDGIRTAAIFTDELQKQLVPKKGELDPEALLKTINDVSELTRRIAEQIRQREMWVTLEEVNERAIWKPSGFDGWLRIQPTVAISQSPFPGSASVHAVDGRMPFVVHRSDDQVGYSVEARAAYWYSRGTNALLAQSHPMEALYGWDTERLQATCGNACLLLCDGIVRGDWGSSIIERIHSDGAVNPIVFVIADGIAKDTEMYADLFTTIILSAPLDQIQNKDGSVERPVMHHMAELFGAQVVRLWATIVDGVDVEPEWGAIGDALGRCELAQIDRQRTVFVSHHEPSVYPPEAVGWFPLAVRVFSQPSSEEESLAKAEMRVRKRIEFEDGASAGGGALFYWLANRLQGDSLAVQIMQKALRAPLRQLMDNVNLKEGTKIFAELEQWIVSPDRPIHTFMIDAKDEWNEETGILRDAGARSRVAVLKRNKPHKPIILGDVRDLNNVTPMPQLARLLPEATSSAVRLVMLELAAHF